MSRVWFHLIASAYGSWLPGDPWGFRTWHHKEHVEGDYRNPPPDGAYDGRHDHARRLQREQTAYIPPAFREVIGLAFIEQLVAEGGRVLVIAVGGQHVHVQVQLEECDARIPLGKAKLHAWHAARKRSWSKKMWVKRGKVIRIGDRDHQRNAYWYILDHRKEGAWVWSELEQTSTEGVEPLGF